MPLTEFDWNVVVFARNEAAALPGCLAAIQAAIAGHDARVDVVLNGCTDNSPALAAAFGALAGMPLRVWRIDFADKSNAWNQYVQAIRPAARLHFFVDAYAKVKPDAFAKLEAALAAAPAALAAAAVPSCGRSAASTRAAMLQHPALHGSLHALRGSFLARVQRAGLNLPVGLYRGDGLIGSLVMHDLDAQAHEWDASRIVVAPEATWEVRPLSPWRLADLRRFWNRRIQQARGRLEDAALREAIYADGFARLPGQADCLLRRWMARHPSEVPTDGFTKRALARLRASRKPEAAALVATRFLPPHAAPPHQAGPDALPCT